MLIFCEKKAYETRSDIQFHMHFRFRFLFEFFYLDRT